MVDRIFLSDIYFHASHKKDVSASQRKRYHDDIGSLEDADFVSVGGCPGALVSGIQGTTSRKLQGC